MMYTCLGQWGVVEYGPSSNAMPNRSIMTLRPGSQKILNKKGRALQKRKNKDS